MVIPLYGFLQGDSIGILVLAHDTDTVSELAGRLRRATSVRLENDGSGGQVRYRGQILNSQLTLTQAGFEALDRFDVEAFEEGDAHDHL
jgi:hypothetical protein